MGGKNAFFKVFMNFCKRTLKINSSLMHSNGIFLLEDISLSSTDRSLNETVEI